MKVKAVILIFSLQFLTIIAFGQSSLFEVFSKKDGLKSDQILDINESSTGDVYVLVNNAFCKFNGLGFECNNLNDSSIVAFDIDNNQKIWFYSSFGKIYKYDKGKLILAYTLNISPFETSIVNNFICKGSEFYVSLILPAKAFQIKNNKIIEIAENQSSNHLIYTVFNSHISFSPMSDMSDEVVHINQEDTNYFKLSRASISSKSFAIQLKDSSFLFGKDFELIQYKSGKVLNRLFLEKNIQHLFQSKDGKIWISLYNGGVICYPNGLIAAKNIHYLGKKTITKTLEDKEGNLWFCSPKNGLYLFPNKPELTYVPPKVFVKKDTIKNDKAFSSSAEMNKQEKNTLKELIAADDSTAPLIFINHIKVMGKDTTIQQHYDFNYDQNFITIDFIGFSKGTNEGLQYKYILQGLDKNWTYTNNMSVQYTTLPAGNYQFIVSSMNKIGIWSEHEATFTFTISPPFWSTWWFILITGATIIAIVIVGMYLWSVNIKSKATFEKRIHSLELQALRSQMNPHFLFNTLSSIQYFITQNDNKTAINYLAKFAKLMRKILDNSQKAKISLEEEVETLELYLTLEKLRFKDKLNFKIVVDSQIDAKYEEIPTMLIQPYVENAILHGILHKEEGGEIQVKLSKKEKNIICEVTDNGVGRKKAAEIENSKTKIHKSSGMNITKERLNLLHKNKNADIHLDIIDLFDENNEPSGTRVKIIIPT
jgi:hypothetical protein